MLPGKQPLGREGRCCQGDPPCPLPRLLGGGVTPCVVSCPAFVLPPSPWETLPWAQKWPCWTPAPPLAIVTRPLAHKGLRHLAQPLPAPCWDQPLENETVERSRP